MILGERLLKQLGFLQDPKWGGGILYRWWPLDSPDSDQESRRGGPGPPL